MRGVDEVVATCVFHIAKRRAVARRAGEGAAEFGSPEKFDEWRRNSLEREFLQLFDRRSIEGKDVLDFGCGSGALSLAIACLGARRVCGVDLDANAIDRAKRSAEDAGIDATFRLAQRTDRIDMADGSVDVVLCFDVLEHIAAYEQIIAEWRRVLRPDGKILIWWSPYFHPYGHHVHAYAPIPWLHVFCSDKIISMVCSKMVNYPDFRPPFWDLDGQGNRIDRFAGAPPSDYLNHLKIAEFERICRANGFRFARREFHTFSALKRLPAVGALLTLPGLREFFSAYTVYEIAAPRRAATAN